ncbi:MAG: hypothetical protein HQ552_01495 [Desulfobacteraceae bacterium]|nr:hypothetical protein [Desulfobacteraceae bacterium]
MSYPPYTNLSRGKCLTFIGTEGSGDPAPSSDDMAITRRLVVALSSIGVTLHDHLIVGDTHYSFADEGALARLHRSYKEFENGM